MSPGPWGCGGAARPGGGCVFGAVDLRCRHRWGPPLETGAPSGGVGPCRGGRQPSRGRLRPPRARPARPAVGSLGPWPSRPAPRRGRSRDSVAGPRRRHHHAGARRRAPRGARARGVHVAAPPRLGFRGRGLRLPGRQGGRRGPHGGGRGGLCRPQRRRGQRHAGRRSPGGLAFWVAALAGVLRGGRGPARLPGRGRRRRRPGGDRPRTRVARLAALRAALNAGEIRFLDACRQAGLRLATDRVHYFSHWITPEPAPKRYDTRFFVAALPAGPGAGPRRPRNGRHGVGPARRRPGPGQGGRVRPHLPHHEEPRGHHPLRDQRRPAGGGRGGRARPHRAAPGGGGRPRVPHPAPRRPRLRRGRRPGAGSGPALSPTEVGAIVRTIGADGRAERARRSESRG